MKTLGLLGGMTYHATLAYYAEINGHVQKQLGGVHAAKLLLHSFNYHDVITPWKAGDMPAVSRMLCDAARNLQSIGADAIVLCVNTNHLFAEDIERATPGIPLLHIIDFTAEAILRAGLKKIALLGTTMSMGKDFLKGRLKDKYGLEVLLPSQDNGVWEKMDEAIFGDLPKKIITPETKKLYLDAVEDLVSRGAQGIILGCTELAFVLEPKDVSVPLFDTVELHARGVAQWAVDN
ncbi:Asp/Glu/hydantoin racemase [Stachybotrys elegans]|uniref:Asp/Glu/hydantoin racemase n=1 Tax=Stachybotrys elegans TaxID=80388 RepID=A0A8K0WRP8_9HYPO|nr:Asp/Glu/hydantoin racemase [Stachybotrys elegans]